MGRHSQNNTARSFHTSAERKMAGYGTQKIRLGRDSQTKFGECCLTLTVAEDPVASPYGYIYSRDAIIENLGEQLAEIKRLEKAFRDQERQKQRDAEEEDEKSKRQKIEQFEALETKSAVAPKLHEELANRTVRKVQTGFWVPAHAPEAKPSEITAPKKTPQCPMAQKPLKMKDLIPLKFEWEKSDKGEARVLCAVSKKPITFQKVVCLKPSGVVMLESLLKDVVHPTMTCPVTGVKVTEADIIPLVPGGTGFSAHNTVEASTYRPNI